MLTFKSKSSGFTIVELLIVIVVIAVLASISVVAYNGVQDRARDAKVASDIAMLDKAIQAARVTTGKVLFGITGSGCSGCVCRDKSSSTDLAILDKSTDSCWVSYKAALQKIADASGASVLNIVDPWGRPYDIDENEGVSTPPCGTGKDAIYKYQAGATGWDVVDRHSISYITPGC